MADDIKKDAEAQRNKQAPQPRSREEGGSLSGVIDEIKKGNAQQTKTAEATTGLVANMINIADSIERVGLAGNAAIDTLANNLGGNKLKELETAKENEKRNDKTNELLEELVDNTNTDLLEAPSGFFGKIIAGIAGLSGALIGLVGGFALGVFESIKLMGSGFKNLGGRILTFIDDLFGKNISKGLNNLKGGFKAKLLTPLDDFFKGIKTSFNLGNKGLKTYKASISQTVGNFFGRMTRNLRLAADGITDTAKGLKTTIGGFFGSIGTKFTSAFKGFTTNFGLTDDIKKATDSIKSIKSSIAGFVTPFAKTAEQGKKLKGLVMMAISPFKLFADFFKFFAAKFVPVGKVLGKIFLPVTIIMGIFDGIKGAVTGAAEQEGVADKFVGGIFGAVKGILVGLVGMPIDFLKNIVSWIAGKFGMDSVAESLDGFSVSGLIGNIIDTIRNFFAGAIDVVVGLFTFDGDKIKSGFGDMFGAVGDVVKSILRAVLPDPTAELMSIAGIASRAIPDFVYEYAGINPETGEITPFENDLLNTVKDTGAELNAGSIENEANKNKSSDVNQQAVVDQSVKSSSAQTINIMGGMNLATANELKFQG